MTVHSIHPDTHTHGLYPGCPRCEEHAARPEVGLDRVNTARLLSGKSYTTLDRIAAVNLARVYMEGENR